MENQKNVTEAEAQLSLHTPLDPATKDVASQHVVDDAGRLRSSTTNEHGEIATFGGPSNLLHENRLRETGLDASPDNA
jgi:hypothetical protein